MTNSLLAQIESPSDVKRFSISQLETLVQEVRQRIIEVLSSTGGHLASNLGIVELTLALHKVFDSPKDKLIWDVSHQTYVHKLLTGRNDRFHTIRQFQGLCGFSHPDESPYDHFHAGHAGTALSLGLGVAKNRDLSKGDEYVIPIIGDATLTCGMSLEALNNISRELKRFIVILNDNEMSISKNVGAITRILSRLVSNPTVNQLHQDLDHLLAKIPSVGPALSKQGHKIAESIKNLFSPSAFFEQYGLSYIGPIDGHNIGQLVNVLKRLKNSQWPVVLHIQTKKGQGMPQALQNPVSYHGAKPFSIDTGKFHPSPSKATSFPKIFGNALVELGRKDPAVLAVTPAMSAGSCLDLFMEEFPHRCFDVGIAEGHSVTFAGGLAFHRNDLSQRRKKVFVSIYSTFLQRAFDNLFHDVCLQEIPVVFAIDRAGIAGGDGATHNGIYDLSFLRAMPHLIISQPRNGQVLVDLMHSAFEWDRSACIRYPNLPTSEPTAAPQRRFPGQGELLAEGRDLLIVALGHMNDTALEVRRLAQSQGVSIAVFDPVFVKPLDTAKLGKLLARHKNIVSLEEHSLVGGLGSALNEFCIHNELNDVKMLNLGVPAEEFIQHGKYSDLLCSVGLTPPQILKRLFSHFSLQAKHTSVPVGAIPE